MGPQQSWTEARQVLGARYRLEERVGGSDIAAVWRAFDLVLGRRVAVRTFSPTFARDDRLRERLLSEAQVAARLSHPHLAAVYDYGESLNKLGEPMPYIVTELLEGRTLEERLQNGPPSPNAGLRICFELASGLAYAHAANLIHRAIEPRNVIFAQTGTKLLGLGAATALVVTAGTTNSTLEYASPERIMGNAGATPSSDVYGLGVLIFHVLTGRLPWPVGRQTLSSRAQPEGLPDIDAVPSVVGDLYLRCVAMNPDDRPSARRVASILGATLGVEPLSDDTGHGDEVRGPALPFEHYVELDGSELAAETLAGGISADYVSLKQGIPIIRDHLGVGVYASMLATVVVDRDTPMPLSIGVFGEWGSGKSYFMGLIRSEIDRLAQSPGGSYLSDVVQIGFNAWHYADTNLWASLGDEIFRQLAGPEDPADSRRARLRDELADRLEERKNLEQRTTQAKKETVRLQNLLEAATSNRERTALDLLRAVRRSKRLRRKLNRIWRHIGVHDEMEQAQILAQEVRGGMEEIEALGRSLIRRRAWVGALLGALAAVLVLVAAVVPEQRWITASGAALFAAAAIRTIRRVRAGVRYLRDVATEISDLTDRAAKDRVAPQVNQILAELRHAEADERVTQAQLDQVVAHVGELGGQLADLMPGHRLYSFISERAAGGTYESHLGLISKIRQDFEHLVDLMDDWRRNRGDEEARRPIERIVLYIDDLDRCNPEQVVDVLQAVHLLLALDLFVVVVGVDPRWLLRSLRQQYRRVLDTDFRESSAELVAWEMTPQDYLEKIFNIPFVLPDMAGGSVRRMIQGLSLPRQSDGASERHVPQLDVSDSTPDIGDATGEHPGASAGIPVESQSELSLTMPSRRGARARPITDSELTLLSGLETLIDSPREAKRLLNLYRMLRSTRDLSDASSFLGGSESNGEFQAVAVLLGLLTAHPRLLGSIIDATPVSSPPTQGGLLFQAPARHWNDFASTFAPRPGDGDRWMNGVVGVISPRDVMAWRRLEIGMADIAHLVTLPDLTPFQTWAPRIRRFSFTLSPTRGIHSAELWAKRRVVAHLDHSATPDLTSNTSVFPDDQGPRTRFRG